MRTQEIKHLGPIRKCEVEYLQGYNKLLLPFPRDALTSNERPLLRPCNRSRRKSWHPRLVLNCVICTFCRSWLFYSLKCAWGTKMPNKCRLNSKIDFVQARLKIPFQPSSAYLLIRWKLDPLRELQHEALFAPRSADV